MITVKRTKGRRNVYLDGRPIGLISTRIKDQFRNRAFGREYVYEPSEGSPIPAHYYYRAKTIRELVYYMNLHVRSVSSETEAERVARMFPGEVVKVGDVFKKAGAVDEGEARLQARIAADQAARSAKD